MIAKDMTATLHFAPWLKYVVFTLLAFGVDGWLLNCAIRLGTRVTIE